MESKMSAAGSPIAGSPGNANAPRIQYWEDWFIYELDFAALANGATALANIQIQADSDFKLMKLAYAADIAKAAYTANTQPIPNVSISILDGGSGRVLSSAPVSLQALFGVGQLPYILPIPRLFKAKSTIQFTVANYDAAVTYNLHFALHGTKIMSGGPS